MVYAPTILLN